MYINGLYNKQVLVLHYDWPWFINIGVIDTNPIKNSIAIELKSLRSFSDCNSPRTVPACTMTRKYMF
uniref:Uncharacterized protein n=1 Tax=Rhizophora mucronata TaxID=61149 RepID=A0A2P2IZ77_RHIMU